MTIRPDEGASERYIEDTGAPRGVVGGELAPADTKLRLPYKPDEDDLLCVRHHDEVEFELMKVQAVELGDDAYEVQVLRGAERTNVHRWPDDAYISKVVKEDER